MEQTASQPLPVLARRVMRTTLKGSLATLERGSGAPYVSMVNLAADLDGSPLLLLSELARHTGNLKADSRASLLLDQTDLAGDPSTGARLTLLGRLSPSTDPAVRQRYLERWPSAAGYAGFADFGFWRLDLDSGHVISGFGRIQTLQREDLIDRSHLWPGSS